MKAFLKNYRQSPRKVRLVADMIRGRRVDEALLLLDHTAKRATPQLKKVLLSAVANSGEKPSDLMVSVIRVDEGVTLKRYRPAARGSAHPIRKRTSRIAVELTSNPNPAKAGRVNKPVQTDVHPGEQPTTNPKASETDARAGKSSKPQAKKK